MVSVAVSSVVYFNEKFHTSCSNSIASHTGVSLESRVDWLMVTRLDWVERALGRSSET